MCRVRVVRAADLIREARLRAGLTQAELAARLGKAPSVIGRWEQGRAKPSLETVAAVVRAAGLELSFGLTERDDHDRTLIALSLRKRPHERLQELVEATRAFDRMAELARRGG